MGRKHGQMRIGISGWTYAPWRGTFYPDTLSQKNELAYASRKLTSIEINGTFYSLQRPESYAAWHAATPDDFVFAVKAPRYITHIRRLENPRSPIANFFASGILRLQRKLGPILWQLPPSFRFDLDLLESFIRLLPHNTKQAAQLALDHDPWLEGRCWYEAKTRLPLRHAIEVRHESFRDKSFFKLLKRHNVALVIADTAGKWPFIEELTSDFVYARLHGDKKIYVSGYTPAALQQWAQNVIAWTRNGRDVFVYFDNDVKVRAPYDAISLARRVGIPDRI